MSIFNNFPLKSNKNYDKIIQDRIQLQTYFDLLYTLDDIKLNWDNYRTTDIAALLNQRKACPSCSKSKKLWNFYEDNVLYKECKVCNKNNLVKQTILNAIKSGKIEL